MFVSFYVVVLCVLIVFFCFLGGRGWGGKFFVYVFCACFVRVCCISIKIKIFYNKIPKKYCPTSQERQ